MKEYFFDVRKRCDKFLQAIRPSDMLENLGSGDLRYVDALVEANRLALHYLVYLIEPAEYGVGEVPGFEFSHTAFNYSSGDEITGSMI